MSEKAMDGALADELVRTANLRDFGGSTTQEGRSVRRGQLYRSASLHELSPGHLDGVRALGIGTIVDLRYNAEREVHATPWQALGCGTYWFRDHVPASAGGLDQLLDSGEVTAGWAREMMTDTYRTMPYMILEGIRAFFEAAADGEGAVLVHCTSGKDRTGITSALMLSVLGVPREAIVADYLATRRFDILASAAYRREGGFPMERIEALRPIFSVEPAYIETTLDWLAERHGSVEQFLRSEAGVRTGTIGDARERLLA